MKFPKKFSKSTGKSLGALDKRLWGYFSKFIRMRDADENGYCRCVTCGRPFFWKEGDAGHFIQRDRKATKYDERNVHAQCKHCNKYRSGEQFYHGQQIDRIHGKGTAEVVATLARVPYCKLDRGWYMIKIDEYKRKVKNLRKKIPQSS